MARSSLHTNPLQIRNRGVMDRRVSRSMILISVRTSSGCWSSWMSIQMSRTCITISLSLFFSPFSLFTITLIMESNQVKTKEDGSKAEKDRLSELLDAFDKVAERDSKSLERSASSPPAGESITDADGRMRDLVMSLGQVRILTTW